MGILWTTIYLISRVYFIFLALLFHVLNRFRRKQRVPASNDKLLMISATEAVRKIAGRKITCKQLVEAYIYRIEQVNDLIEAVVVTLFDDAIEKAENIDQLIADYDDHKLAEMVKRRPLLGVPFTVKDALNVNGRVITCGVFSQRNIKCSSTAEVIEKMEAAGAILLAITNVQETCFWMGTMNGIYGHSNNPYDLRRSVGGSSGGEGALISSAGSVIGIGSDIGGSIRVPAFMNGIFGMMNTPGVISPEGHVTVVKGYQKKMLRIGPMCRYIEDIPLLVEVMGGDQVVSLNLRDMVDLCKIRVFYMEGIPDVFMVESLDDDMRSTLRKAVEHFEQKYDIEAIRIDLPLMSKAVKLLFADKGSLNWIVELPKFVLGKSAYTLAALFVSFFESVENKTKNEEIELLRLRNRLTRQIEETLGDNGILLFPSWPHTASYHYYSVFTPFDVAYTGVFNALALPVIQCPMGLDANGLPLGVQIIGAPNSDRLLIAAAKELSHKFGGWTPA